VVARRALARRGAARDDAAMLALARWFFAVVGGVLLGAGLMLHGQVAFARYVKKEVGGTFFLWRAIGDATFTFQGGETRMALAMGEVPEAALRESDRAAWVLVIVGGLVALTGPLLRRGRSGAGGSGARGPTKPTRSTAP
jgi:hypothetical protein